MKHLRKFNTVSEANTAGTSGLDSPIIVKIEEFDKINYARTPTDTFKCSFLSSGDNKGKIKMPNCAYYWASSQISGLSEKFSGVSYISDSFSNGVGVVELGDGGYSTIELCFAENANLTRIDFKSCYYVDLGTFGACTSLSQISLPNCTYVDECAFYSCSSLSQVNLPNCSYVGQWAFRDCISLSQISLSKCSVVGAEAFGYCPSLTQISLPNCEVLMEDADMGSRGPFCECSSLSQISLPNCSYVGVGTFAGCILLSQLTLLYGSIVSLPYVGAFYNTPLESGTGSIYVPSSLVSAYKSATNWAYFSSCIVPYQ